MNGESFPVSILAVLDLILRDHQEFATVVLRYERKLRAFLNRSHRVHNLRIGELNGSLGQSLHIEVGARKLDALHIPAILVEPFVGQHRRHIISEIVDGCPSLISRLPFGFSTSTSAACGPVIIKNTVKTAKGTPFILGSPLGLGLVLTSHSRLTGNLSTNTRQSSPLFPIC